MARPGRPVPREPGASAIGWAPAWLQAGGFPTAAAAGLDAEAAAAWAGTGVLVFSRGAAGMDAGGVPAGPAPRRPPALLGCTRTQDQSPGPAPPGLPAMPTSGSPPMPTCMGGDVPPDGLAWVKIGLAPASSISRRTTKSINPGRLRSIVRNITGPSLV